MLNALQSGRNSLALLNTDSQLPEPHILRSHRAVEIRPDSTLDLFKQYLPQGLALNPPSPRRRVAQDLRGRDTLREVPQQPRGISGRRAVRPLHLVLLQRTCLIV